MQCEQLCLGVSQKLARFKSQTQCNVLATVWPLESQAAKIAMHVCRAVCVSCIVLSFLQVLEVIASS